MLSQFLSTSIACISRQHKLAPPIVGNADDVREKTGGTRQIVLAIGGGDPEARIDFGRKLIEKLKKISFKDLKKIFRFRVWHFKNQILLYKTIFY